MVACSPVDPAPPEYIHSNASRNTDYRLPEGSVDVSLYTIRLNMDHDVFDTTIFEGVSSIRFTNLKNTNQIVLHANGLTISEVVLQTSDGIQISLENENYESDSVTDILVLTTPTPLPGASDYYLQFTYTGILRVDGMHGFYRSQYIDANGDVRYLGTTQFQPVHARKAFPCFDEPSFKAAFDISIRHPQEYSAIGNSKETRVIDST